MSTGQDESGPAVVENRPRPLDRCMTQGAILRETGRHMVRILRVVEIRQMARHAGRCETLKDVVLVAVGAGYRYMRPDQWELRGRVVVELRPFPLDRRVTERAILRESGRRMVRILCVVEIRQMARHTGRCETLEDVVFVAIGAVYGGVRARQLKFSRRIVIEFGAFPLCGCMA